MGRLLAYWSIARRAFVFFCRIEWWNKSAVAYQRRARHLPEQRLDPPELAFPRLAFPRLAFPTLVFPALVFPALL